MCAGFRKVPGSSGVLGSGVPEGSGEFWCVLVCVAEASSGRFWTAGVGTGGRVGKVPASYGVVCCLAILSGAAMWLFWPLFGDKIVHIGKTTAQKKWRPCSQTGIRIMLVLLGIPPKLIFSNDWQGGFLKQGVLFRTGHWVTATAADLRVLRDALQIKTYLDLRNGQELGETFKRQKVWKNSVGKTVATMAFGYFGDGLFYGIFLPLFQEAPSNLHFLWWHPLGWRNSRTSRVWTRWGSPTAEQSSFDQSETWTTCEE